MMNKRYIGPWFYLLTIHGVYLLDSAYGRPQSNRPARRSTTNKASDKRRRDRRYIDRA